MLGSPAVLLFLSCSACLRTAADMICPAKERDALSAYQHRGNGCSLVPDSGCAAWAAI